MFAVKEIKVSGTFDRHPKCHSMGCINSRLSPPKEIYINFIAFVDTNSPTLIRIENPAGAKLFEMLGDGASSFRLIPPEGRRSPFCGTPDDVVAALHFLTHKYKISFSPSTLQSLKELREDEDRRWAKSVSWT